MIVVLRKQVMQSLHHLFFNNIISDTITALNTDLYMTFRS